MMIIAARQIEFCESPRAAAVSGDPITGRARSIGSLQRPAKVDWFSRLLVPPPLALLSWCENQRREIERNKSVQQEKKKSAVPSRTLGCVVSSRLVYYILARESVKCMIVPGLLKGMPELIALAKTLFNTRSCDVGTATHSGYGSPPASPTRPKLHALKALHFLWPFLCYHFCASQQRVQR